MPADSSLFLTAHDLADLRDHLIRDTLMGRTLREQQQRLERWLQTPVWIPGHGEGGGAEHTQHKTHYQMIDLAGLHWLLTDDTRYRDRLLQVLSGYADLYPTLGSAVSRDSNPPGRLFHQTLNEDMFLLYAACGWQCVKGSASDQQRQHIETHLLRAMATEATTTHAATFDIVHNHGIWSVAATAICGYVLSDRTLVDISLHGLQGDDVSGGFFAQLSQLFSIDGYYIEGLYYQRFALRPVLLLAEAIARCDPELAIWQYGDRLIHRACRALFDMAFPDGTLPALNDASKTMNLRDEGAIMAASLCRQHEGSDESLTALARYQQTVWPCRGGLQLSEDVEQPFTPLPRPALLFRDGVSGERGAGGILRQGSGSEESMAMLWWGGHGNIAGLHSALNHGHFDSLHLSWFTRGHEVLQDYGFARWVNVEPKFGGRYVPENNRYAKQTVAHNTVVVDEGCQNQGDKAVAAGHHGDTHFFIDRGAHQGMSAFASDDWPGVHQQRSVLLLRLPQCEHPLLLDLFALTSDAPHQYDYCQHTLGQLIDVSVPLTAPTVRQPLGEACGYQHLFDCARAPVAAGESAQLRWLLGSGFYTTTCVMPESGTLIVARSGASDPQANLREEPVWIWRQQAASTLFACVVESHGDFDESQEISLRARGNVKGITVMQHDRQLTQVTLTFHQGEPCTVSIDNRPGHGSFTLA